MSTPYRLLVRISSQFFPSSTSPHINFTSDARRNLCGMLEPCQNNGGCYTTDNQQTYNCICPSGFSGPRCQSDDRPCKDDTCWNNGKHLCSSILTNSSNTLIFQAPAATHPPLNSIAHVHLVGKVIVANK